MKSTPKQGEQNGETSPTKRRGPIKRFSEFIDGHLQRILGQVGYWAGHHPKKTIMVSLLITVFLLIGLVNYDEESRAERLFVNEEAAILDHLGIIRREFDGEPRETAMYIYGRNGVGDNILTYDALEEIFDVEEVVRGTTATAADEGDQERQWTFDEVCFERVNSNGGDICSITSVIDIWSNRTALQQDRDAGVNLGEKISQLEESGELTNRFGEMIDFARYFGGVKRKDDGTLDSVEAFRMDFKLQDRSFFRSGETIDPVGENWELAFVDNIGKTKNDGQQASFDEIAVATNAPASFIEEFSNAIGDDLALVGVSIVVLIAYVIFQFSGKPCRRSSIGLGLGAVATVGLALGWAFGIGSTLSPFTQVHNVLPFLLFGIGIDDAFVVREAYLQVKDEVHPGRRMRRAIADVGTSLLLTSLTDFIAFMIGSTTVLPALSAFAEWAAFGIVGAFFMSITFFAALVTLDEERKKNGRYDVMCCYGGLKNETKTSQTPSDPDEHSEGTNPIKFTSQNHNGHDKAGNSNTRCVDRERDETLQSYIVRQYSEVLLSKPGKVIVIIGFCCIIAMATVGVATELEVDFRIEWFLPAGSFIKKFFEIENDHFRETGPAVEIILRDFVAYERQNLLNDTQTAVLDNKFIRDDSGIDSWYRGFTDDVDVSQLKNRTQFDNALSGWFNGQGRRFGPDVRFRDQSTGTIAIMRMRASYRELDSSSDKLNAMKTLRSDLNKVARENNFPEKNIFPFSQEYVDWEIFDVVEDEAIQNLSLAAASTFIVVMIFLGSFGGALAAALAVGLSLLCITGYMGYWNVTLEGVSIINLVLAIGLTVDYTVHIVHSFLHKNGTRTERAKKALCTMGVSVLNGATSTFLAVVVLSASGSFIFTVFFKMFFLSVVFGADTAAHGMILIPVLLSICGPESHDIVDFHDPVFATEEDKDESV